MMSARVLLSKLRREASISLISAVLSSASQYYRIPEIRHLRQLIRALEIDCVFDVGANAGQYARMIRRWVGFRGRIISFEPNPEVLPKLTALAAHDRFWTVEPFALTTENGRLKFNATVDSQFSSFETLSEHDRTASLESRLESRQVAVDCRRLDEEFERLKALHGFKRPLLKMDTQGHDLSVFRSGSRIVDQFAALQSELSFVPYYEGVPKYDEVIKEYEESGFRLSSIFLNNRGNSLLLREMDCLMLNEKFFEKPRAI
jgi:FkbM family methyltransferase